MSTKYTVRVASPVAYEYWEATSDSYEEMLAAEQELRELKQQASGGEVSPAQAETNVKKAFGNVSKPAFGGSEKKTFGSSSSSESVDKYELGEHEGYKISVWKGRKGWCFNAYNRNGDPQKIYADLPKGMDPAKATLDEAIEAIAAKVAAA